MSEERLKEILVQVSEGDVTMESIQAESDVIDDLKFDSIKFLEAIVRIEEEAGIELDDEDIDEISKFSSLYEIISKKTGEL